MTLIPPDQIELSLEQSLDFCIKCNICTAACPVSAVTDLFPGPKYVGPQAQRFRKADQPSPDESVDYCSGCRVCNTVCPTGVRIAELNARARAKIVADRGLPLRNRLIGRSELLGQLGCGPQAPLANFTLRNRPLRWAIERAIGIARAAPLPPFSTYSFRSWFKKRPTTGDNPRSSFVVRRSSSLRSWFKKRPTTSEDRGWKIEDGGSQAPEFPSSILHPPSSKQPSFVVRRSSEPRQVVYFHGCSTNYYEPHVGIAAVEVLERNGFEVIVAEQNCCGLPMLSNGDFDAARRYHERNIVKLLPYVQRGIAVVGTSTSCTLTLKEEAPELLGMHEAGARMLAEQTYDIFEFLRLLHERGELNTNFKPVERTLPYHPPCQLRAHRIGRPALDVLELVPGLRLNESVADCCGIAGTYGLKREKYQIAMDVGAGLFDFVRAASSADPSPLALCDSETCRWQITHGSGVATKHPIEILREAYL